MKTQKLEQNKRIQTLCKHYWLIEPPTSETSLGICKYCGISKRFANKLNEYKFVGIVTNKSLSDDHDSISEDDEYEYI